MNVPKSLQNIDINAILRSRGIFEKQKEYQDIKKAAYPLAKQMVQNRYKKAPQRHAQFSDEIVLAYWEKQIHVVDVIEKKFEVKLNQFITKMVDGFLTHLESEIAITKSFQNKDKDYFSDNEDDLLVAAQLDFTPLLLDQAVLAGNEALRLISSKDIYTPSFRKQIAENVAKFTQSMIDTDRDTLINIITQGLQNGHSIPDIRKEITDTFDSITKNQAQRITRTEVLRVSNQAALDAWEQSGVVEGKQWLTAGAVDECADYEGDIVYDLGGNFYSDITEFKDGGPPLHPNCRCVVLPILVGEKGYVAQSNKAMRARIIELESQIDKRTKAYREIKELKADGEIYIKRLEAALNKED